MARAPFTVAQYLVERLHELGVGHLFSIPGDYIVPFLQVVDDDGRIQRIGNTNEMEAGYAADGYARLHGIGAVAVTYGVGSLSLASRSTWRCSKTSTPPPATRRERPCRAGRSPRFAPTWSPRWGPP